VLRGKRDEKVFAGIASGNYYHGSYHKVKRVTKKLVSGERKHLANAGVF